MDEHLKNLVRKLGESINDSINNSSEVDAALESLRDAGHEVLLVLEATIVFKEKLPEKNGQPLASLTYEDRQFLRNLNIRFESDS